MSVAFRRDSDEEHLEPKFARPIPPGPNLVTLRGKAQIDAQVKAAEAMVAAAVGEPAMAAAKRELTYWQSRQSTAEIATAPSCDHVGIGVTVSVLHNNQPRTFTIVGVDEADAEHALIGFTAPLARAMTGAEVGDLLPFAGRDDAIEILSISLPVGLPARSSP